MGGDPEKIDEIVLYGIARMARRNPDDATILWEKLAAGNRYSEAEAAEIHKQIGLNK